MKRIAAFTSFLLLAVSSLAGPPRRAVAHPAPPVSPSPNISSWTVEIMTSGGIAAASRTGVVVQSTGEGTLLNYLGRSVCTEPLDANDLGQLTPLVAQADPEAWASSYALPSNPGGCCDQIRTTVRLTRATGGTQPAVRETYWFDDHPALPADLASLHERVYGAAPTTFRSRFEAQCLSAPAAATWSITITEDGGFAYRDHRVTADSSGNGSVRPNPRSAGCAFALTAGETQQLGDLVMNAQAAAWATSYTRAGNPTGCCDQVHTSVQLIRSEPLPTGQMQQITYATEWFSDHPLLPSDLTDIYSRLFGIDPSALFQRFAPQCGPVF